MSNTISRRSFLKGVVALGAGATLYRYSNGSYRIVMAAAGPEVYKLRIIHTNDHHARIEPATAITVGAVGSTPATRNFGGVARRKTIFDQIKADNTIQDKLFLDAGDVFQGTLYFNLFDGVADLFFYNALGYHAMTLGNHEFDKSDQKLANFIAGANFPLVSANVKAAAPSPLQPLQVAGDSTANGKLGERTIVTLPSGEKVGIFGLTTPETPLLSSPSANVTFNNDLVAVAQAQVDALKTAGVNKIVALTHVGYLVDLDLASKVKGIDVIVGGHSHTPLLPDSQQTLPLGIKRVAGYPTVVQDPDGNNVLVVTDWEWGKWVGDVVVGFDAQGNVTSAAAETKVRPVWADGILPANRALLTGEEAEITADAAFQSKIDTDYKPQITALQAQKIGTSDVALDGERQNVRTKETNLGNLIAEALRARIMAETDFNPQKLPVVCLTNGGGIRKSINAGDVTVGNVLEVLPFGNTLATVILTGAQLNAALETGVSQVESAGGRFPQVAGLRFSWSLSGKPATPATTVGTATFPAQKGTRVITVEVYEESATQAERAIAAEVLKPLDLQKKYLVVTNNFMLTGGDGYSVFTTAGDKADPSVGGGTNQLDTGLIMADVVQDYIAVKTPVNIKVDGRINGLNRLIFFPVIRGN